MLMMVVKIIMNYNTILFIGTGQIGKAVLNQILNKQLKKVIVHNLTEKESIQVCKFFSKNIQKLNL